MRSISRFLKNDAYLYLAAWCYFCETPAPGKHSHTVWPPTAELACPTCGRTTKHYHPEESA